MMTMHNDYYKYLRQYRRGVDYEYKDPQKLQAEALNDKMTKINHTIDGLKRELEKMTASKVHVGELNSNRVKIRLRMLEREVASIQRELARSNKRSDEQILDTRSLERSNEKYEKQALKIAGLEDDLTSKKEAAMSMSNGFAKRKAVKKITKLEKKLEKMKKKGVKLQKKTTAKLVRRNSLKLYKNRKANKLLAKRDVYNTEMIEAKKMADAQGNSRFEQSFYDHRVVKYAEKKKKIDKKILEMRQKRVIAQGGTPKTIPTRTQTTSRTR